MTPRQIAGLRQLQADFRASFPPTPDTLALSRHRDAQEEGIACEHTEIDVARNFASGPDDDHETYLGTCKSCQQWVIATRFFSRPDEVEARVMSAGEIAMERAS